MISTASLQLLYILFTSYLQLFYKKAGSGPKPGTRNIKVTKR